MTVSTQLHMAAGIGALVMGVACLMADPGRRRNRLFTALCFSMALWTLGMAAVRSGLPLGPRDVWGIRLFLFGSCAAAPLGLHFSLALCWPGRRLPGVLLAAAYSAAAGVWSITWFRPVTIDAEWKITAILVLGAILSVALGLLVRKTLVLSPGPERRAYFLVTLAAILAVIGGLSDFIPRKELDYPKFGPVALILFVLVVSGVVLRHRFLDVDRFLVQAAALIAGAGVMALALYGAFQLFGYGFLALFIVSLAALLLTPSTGKLLMAGARDLMARPGPMAVAFAEVSRNLPGAESPDEIWEVLREGRKRLPEHSEVILYLRDGISGIFRPVRFRSDDDPVDPPDPVPEGHPVPGLLAAERCPLHPRLLEEEIRESESRSHSAEQVLEWCLENSLRILVPIFSEDTLRGWIAVGGIPRSWVTADLAASIQAVGNQAIASLDRLEALEASKQRRALAAVGEMAAGLAHEIRNPLAAIRGASQAINPDASEEQSREMLEVIDEESDRLGRVVGEFLDYARPTSPRREPVDLITTAYTVARDAELAGLDLEIQIQDPDLPVTVSGDPDQIRRSFENLVRNAHEAAGTGGRLIITPGVHEDGSRYIRFEDDGPGIPDEIISKLFQPFFTTRPSGTGLGLALIHRIMEAHGGAVEVDGRLGKGAMFTLLFPGERLCRTS